jgi:hypothetical protein
MKNPTENPEEALFQTPTPRERKRSSPITHHFPTPRTSHPPRQAIGYKTDAGFAGKGVYVTLALSYQCFIVCQA